MREIKFRVWHTELKKMFSAKEMGKDQLTLMPDGRGFINVSECSRRLSQFMNTMIPLEFTGLRDSHGNEIYEGDIVESKLSMIFDLGAQQQVVEFKNGMFMLGNCSLFTTTETPSHYEPKVIGNIYETRDKLRG